jgi:SAM-dependent methyltransferase
VAVTERHEPWAPLGAALSDYSRGETDAAIDVWRDGVPDDPIPASVFFRGPEEMPSIEELALSVCSGRILDVGASAGCHTLALESQGARVVAIDLSPLAVDVMRARGVRDARTADVFTFSDEAPFDTLLLMMNGIGVVGSLERLEGFFARARALLRPHGQILFDSTDLRCSENPDVLRGVAARTEGGRYFGEVTYELGYEGLRGAPYGWLYVDPETVREHARRSGFHDQILFEDEDRQYLVRLTRT